MNQTQVLHQVKPPEVSLTPTSKSLDVPVEKPLSQQYGGVHAGGWVNRLPKAWIPYVQLSRLSPPAGFILIYLPHLFGVIHAASMTHGSIESVLYVSGVLLVGSLFCNNSSHAWNDLVDAPIDAQIERTKTRPIPRGAISPTFPTIIGTIYYPFAKRHTHLPQVVLGFCLTWGIMIGSSAMGVEKPWADTSTVCLLLGSVLWVILFDIIYAHQDLADDMKVGVKSLAVLINGYAKPFLWTLVMVMTLLLYYSGVYGEMGPLYFLITVGGCASSVGAMVALVDLKDPASCWMWFANGFWLTGTSIVAGLVANYVVV
ncbi:hypothetical protein QQS21_003835 [Conoideocrella luteorostrata]|uniref:UbiA prenyltransferase n=1 Tax=Conoideocrella luteorostrata TaxID=1105319 RepID=A0AAJ0FV89_9HYPO|nr:hypothetical protein QQS21_003835 [Conoideocrella luteorostrata]